MPGAGYAEGELMENRRMMYGIAIAVVVIVLIILFVI